jgi:hypothetical protein
MEFQCAQADGLDSWDNVFIKIVTMFRDGCLEPFEGQAHKADTYKQIKYAFTKFVPGNLRTIEGENDNVEARTQFLKTMFERFLPDHKDMGFMLNYVFASNLPVVTALNNHDDDQVLDVVSKFTVAALKLLTRFSPVCIVMDDAHHCDRESLQLMKFVLAELGSDVLIVACARTGSRTLTDMRLHVPTMSVASSANAGVRQTIAATNAFAAAGQGKLKLKSGLGKKLKNMKKKTMALKETDEEEDEKKDDASTGKEDETQAAAKVLPGISSAKPVPPKLGSQPVPPKLGSQPGMGSKNNKFNVPSAPRFSAASPRKSVMEKRMKAKENAVNESKQHVMEASDIKIVAKEEKDVNECNLDALGEEILASSPEMKVSKILLAPLDFNETIALTSAVLGCEKVCNITAAAMYGHTQGNPKYVLVLRYSSVSNPQPLTSLPLFSLSISLSRSLSLSLARSSGT